MSFTAETPIDEIGSLDKKLLKNLTKIGYAKVHDLLSHYPKRHENREQFNEFPYEPTESPICFKGEVIDSSKKFYGRRRFFEALISDSEGAGINQITLRWFNMVFIHKIIMVGHKVIVYGKVKKSGKRLIIDHPEFEIVDADNTNSGIHLDRITPIYPLSSGISQRPLREVLFNIIENLEEGGFPEILPPNNFVEISRIKALRAIHFPASDKELATARRALACEEFFILQLNVAYRKAQHNALPGSAHCGPGKLLSKLLSSLPFEMTSAQSRCVDEIRSDLASPKPMNRLLQGDVGSGKTLVAVCAILLAVEAGSEAALMAPTQILAEQHHAVLSQWLEPLGINVGLCTAKKKTGSDLPLFEQNSPGVIVGTHALLYDSADSKNLGLIVIDEQHKFGVSQRQKLINKGSCPDVLVMTATPIPRTLTLTVYGDLDVSVIDELPPGRGKINTHVRQSKKHLPDSIKFLKTKLREGRQAYIVYPLIEDSEKIKVGSVEGEFQQWSENLSPFKCELLHGRIPPEEKDSIMDRFRSGSTHVLISTTVIEVGVDVPNATIMYVFDAERFGLAQLHQLRGRIGRGKHNSYCVLMAGKVTNDSKAKLKALEESSDGFVIAEADLKLRGPGELLGKAQSGIDRLKLGDLITETELVKQTRSLSSALIKLDPNIENPENIHLRTLIMYDDDNDGVVA